MGWIAGGKAGGSGIDELDSCTGQQFVPGIDGTAMQDSSWVRGTAIKDSCWVQSR
jgi:hypothetical protein